MQVPLKCTAIVKGKKCGYDWISHEVRVKGGVVVKPVSCPKCKRRNFIVKGEASHAATQS